MTGRIVLEVHRNRNGLELRGKGASRGPVKTRTLDPTEPESPAAGVLPGPLPVLPDEHLFTGPIHQRPRVIDHDWGRRAFDRVFGTQRDQPGHLLSWWESQVSEALEAGEDVELIVDLAASDERSLAWPWEALVAPTPESNIPPTGYALGLAPNAASVDVVRRITDFGRAPPALISDEAKQPLDGTVALAHVGDHQHAPVKKVHGARAHLFEHLKGRDLSWNQLAGEGDLTRGRPIHQRLSNERTSILDIVAHCPEYSADHMVAWNGATEPWTGPLGLAALVNSHAVRSLKVVVLSCCHTAQCRHSASPIPALLYSGIPAAIGWYGPTSQRVQHAFGVGFYHALARGAPLARAVSEARTTILNSPDGIESHWQVHAFGPRLFVHPDWP